MRSLLNANHESDNHQKLSLRQRCCRCHLQIPCTSKKLRNVRPPLPHLPCLHPLPLLLRPQSLRSLPPPHHPPQPRLLHHLPPSLLSLLRPHADRRRSHPRLHSLPSMRFPLRLLPPPPPCLWPRHVPSSSLHPPPWPIQGVMLYFLRDSSYSRAKAVSSFPTSYENLKRSPPFTDLVMRRK